MAAISYRTLEETCDAFVEPFSVGDILPDMPIFLGPDRYVMCPLEASYQTSWEVYPVAMKTPLTAP